MRDTHHLLLLTLVAIPACGEKVDDDADEDGSADLTEACIQYTEHFYTCSGYEREVSSQEYCAEGEKYFEGYSDACQDALADHWACLSEVDCATLDDLEASDRTCADTRRNGHDTCPLLFPYCEASTGSSGASPCIEGRTGCVDGKTYELECADQSDGAVACECKIDGTAVSAFDVESTSCVRDYISQEMFERCGFPEGV